MILANDFSSGLIRFQKLLAQMANRVLLDLARADNSAEGGSIAEYIIMKETCLH